MVIYTDRFIKKEWDAMNLFFVTLIRPQFKGVKFIVEHEKVHTRQVFRWLIFQPIFYQLSKKWRLKFELEAYKVSVEHGQSVNSAAWAIANLYGLDITKDEAKELLVGNTHT